MLFSMELEVPTLLGIKICSLKIAAPNFQEREREIGNSFTVFLEKWLWRSLFVVKLQTYSVQHFQKMNSFTDVFFNNFAYFSGKTILRNTSELLVPHAGIWCCSHSQKTDERWKKETYWSQNCQGIEGMSMVKKLTAKKSLYN